MHMRSPELPNGGHTVIRGSYVDILLDNQDHALEEYLDTVHGVVNLWRAEPEELLFPVQQAEMNYSRELHDDIGLHGTLDFEATVANCQKIGAWDNFLSKKLRAHVEGQGLAVHKLKHQRHDFYVRLNDSHAVHVQFATSMHDCHINLHLERLSELHFASEGKIHFTENDDEQQDNYETLRQFSCLFSLAIDTVTVELGSIEQDEAPKPSIRIAPPHMRSSENDDNETIEIAGWADKNEFGIPLAEYATDGMDGLDGIGGLSHAKQRLAVIADIFQDPDGARMYGVTPNHFLLHGPAGTGKTSLVNAFAHDIGAEVMNVDSTTFVDMWVGNSGKHVKELFASIREQAEDGTPIVVFMDEFEALAQKGKLGSSERQDVKKMLNQEIDRLGHEYPNVIIAATTNADLMDLEDSLIRAGRIEPIGAPLPNEAERIDIWGAVLLRSMLSFKASADILVHDSPAEAPAVFVPYADDINLPELARRTEGMTGADFTAILEAARREKFHVYQRTNERVMVRQEDLLRIIEHYGR